MNSRQDHAWRSALAVVAWLALSAFLASETYVASRYAQEAISGPRIFSLAFVQWCIWGVFALLILWFTRAYPIERPHLTGRIALHVLLSLAFDIDKIAIDVVIAQRWFGVAHPTGGSLHHVNILTYWVIVAVAHGFMYYSRYRSREIRTAQLEAQLAETRLHVLQAQIHPHFLFNTLQAISTLLHTDSRAADDMLIRLSDLLRASLDGSAAQKTTLAQEAVVLEAFLAIERVRLGSRLTTIVQIADDAHDALVPALVLLPLAENAVDHGIAPRTAPGTVRVAAEQHTSMLTLTVEDDGIGISDTPRAGIGLNNTRARLQALYPDAHRIEVRRRDGGGTVVTIAIPYERAQAPARDAV